MGRRVSSVSWLAVFTFYYPYPRPNQALDDRTLVEEMMIS